MAVYFLQVVPEVGGAEQALLHGETGEAMTKHATDADDAAENEWYVRMPMGFPRCQPAL